ncbi:hypothetical protein [Paenisporosarcina sp. NPDC076898]|uniref:hypothetical protein n=1 Tax=unclassified Paenisporosarcina TaxID=2642018 RepID=UPI003CFCE583
MVVIIEVDVGKIGVHVGIIAVDVGKIDVHVVKASFDPRHFSHFQRKSLFVQRNCHNVQRSL